jgi:hypothetical protein
MQYSVNPLIHAGYIQVICLVNSKGNIPQCGGIPYFSDLKVIALIIQK